MGMESTCLFVSVYGVGMFETVTCSSNAGTDNQEHNDDDDDDDNDDDDDDDNDDDDDDDYCEDEGK